MIGLFAVEDEGGSCRHLAVADGTRSAESLTEILPSFSMNSSNFIAITIFKILSRISENRFYFWKYLRFPLNYFGHFCFPENITDFLKIARYIFFFKNIYQNCCLNIIDGYGLNPLSAAQLFGHERIGWRCMPSMEKSEKRGRVYLLAARTDTTRRNLNFIQDSFNAYGAPRSAFRPMTTCINALKYYYFLLASRGKKQHPK